MARNKKNTDGRYRYRVYIGKDEDGNKKFKSFYGATEREAKAAAAEYRAAISKGLDPEQSNATLGKLYDNLIAVKKAKGIGEKSLARYEDNRDAWGALKDMPAGELKAADFQRVLNDLADWHDGKPPLSHFTLTNLRSSAKAAYNLAIPEIVLYNPIIKVTCPAGAPAEPREPISEEQQQWDPGNAAQGPAGRDAASVLWPSPWRSHRPYMGRRRSGHSHDHGHQRIQLHRQEHKETEDRRRVPRGQYPEDSGGLPQNAAGRLPVCAAQR